MKLSFQVWVFISKQFSFIDEFKPVFADVNLETFIDYNSIKKLQKTKLIVV